MRNFIKRLLFLIFVTYVSTTDPGPSNTPTSLHYDEESLKEARESLDGYLKLRQRGTPSRFEMQPVDIRRTIYDYLARPDIYNLAQTGRSLQAEVVACYPLVAAWLYYIPPIPDPTDHRCHEGLREQTLALYNYYSLQMDTLDFNGLEDLMRLTRREANEILQFWNMFLVDDPGASRILRIAMPPTYFHGWVPVENYAALFDYSRFTSLVSLSIDWPFGKQNNVAQKRLWYPHGFHTVYLVVPPPLEALSLRGLSHSPNVKIRWQEAIQGLPHLEELTLEDFKMDLLDAGPLLALRRLTILSIQSSGQSPVVMRIPPLLTYLRIEGTCFRRFDLSAATHLRHLVLHDVEADTFDSIGALASLSTIKVSGSTTQRFDWSTLPSSVIVEIS